MRQELYLNITVVIEQYIFQLQVPVDHTILKWEDRQGIEWEQLGWEKVGEGEEGGEWAKGNLWQIKEMRQRRWSSPPSFRASLTVMKLPASDQHSTSDRRALVTCCVVKGKMTGIHSPPEPVKQRGDSLSECNSTVWKPYSPRQWQTLSVCDAIPREAADFSAGDSECGAHRPCLSVCLPVSPVPGSICSDPGNHAHLSWG